MSQVEAVLTSQINELLTLIKTAIKRLDQRRVTEGCSELIALVEKAPDAVSERQLLDVLKGLRRKRMFADLARTAAACLEQLDSPLIRTLLAQAFIDQGMLVAGRDAVEAVLARANPTSFAAEEARGLRGRVLKQAFVQPNRLLPQGAEALKGAIRAYREAYQQARFDPVWPGVNLLALLVRAQRDQVDPEVALLPQELAAQLKARIQQELASEQAKAQDQGRDPNEQYWLLASGIEVSLALGDSDDAIRHANDYLASRTADAFEFASTARQLREIWRLDECESAKIAALPMLIQAEALQQGGGGGFISEPARLPPGLDDGELQSVYGAERFQTYKWMRQGLNAADAVARIERSDGFGVGTGFLVRGRSLASDWGDRQFLLTNHHVIREGSGGAVTPDQAIARFTSHTGQDGTEGVPIDRVVWYSEQLDVAVVALKRHVERDAVVTTDTSSNLQVGEPPARIYVIGHPGGQPLSYSMYDNEIVAYDAPFLYYRSPTEQGNSGSPLFTRSWAAIGIHHHGSNPKYRANGGTLLREVRS